MSKWRDTPSGEELDPYEESDTEDEEAGFVLNVETIMGNMFHVFAYPSDTIELLKTRIAFQEGIPQTDQNLLLGKKTLDDNTLLSDLGLKDESTLKIITNIASGLPYKRDLSSRQTNDDEQLKLPRLTDNQIDGVLVLRDKNDRRVFLIVKRTPTNNNEPEQDESFKKSTISKSGRDSHLQRIKENAKTLQKMSEIRQTLKKRTDVVEKLELPRLDSLKTYRSRTINSSISSLNRLKAEIYLQCKRDSYFPGSPPYSQEQLCKYVQLKVNILLSDNPTTTRFLRLSSKVHGLTPTVIINRKLWAGNNKKKENFILMSSSNNSIDRIPSASANFISTGRQLSARILLSRPVLKKFPVNKMKTSSENANSATESAANSAAESSSESTLNSTQSTAASIKKKKGSSVRCHECRKKMGIVCRYSCRCGLTFCMTHRYPEAHKCTFDYKEEGRRLIREANPLIVPTKVPEI